MTKLDACEGDVEALSGVQAQDAEELARANCPTGGPMSALEVIALDRDVWKRRAEKAERELHVEQGRRQYPAMSAMTKERLARWRSLAAETPHNDFVDVVTTVEALQAELAEEQAKHEKTPKELAQAERDRDFHYAGHLSLAEQRNLFDAVEALQAELAQAEKDRDFHYAGHISLAEQRDDALEALAEERALTAGLRRDLHNEIVRFCCLDSNLSDVDEEREAAEKRAQEAEDIANLAMRVGLEMVEEANAWGQAAVCKAVVDRDLAIQRAEAAERDLRAEARREALEEAERGCQAWIEDWDGPTYDCVLGANACVNVIRALKEKKP